MGKTIFRSKNEADRELVDSLIMGRGLQLIDEVRLAVEYRQFQRISKASYLGLQEVVYGLIPSKVDGETKRNHQH